MTSMEDLLNYSLRTSTFHSENGAIAEEPKMRIDIRLQTLGRRKLTIISGLSDEKTCKNICTTIKKSFAVGGAVKKDEENGGWIVQTQGDKRPEIREMLADILKIRPESIIMHGY